MKPTIVSRPLLPLALAIAVPAGFTFGEEEKVTFQDHVLPVLEANCLNCHNPDESKGGLDLSTYSATLTGGSGGEIALSQDPLGSRLFTLMAHKEEPFMPPKKPKMADKDLAVIQQWIDGGMLETMSSKAKKNDRPTLNLNLTTTTGKPDGPPPMPEHLILQPEVLTDRPNAVPAIAHSPWAPIVAIAGQKQVLLYHSEDLDLLGVLPYPEGFPQALSFSSNGSLLICGGGRGGKAGNVVAWDITTGERVIEVGKEFDIVLGADISPDHRTVVLGGPGKNIKLWDTVKGEQTNSIKKHPDWMLTADFSPDGVLFATGGRNADLYIWEGGTGYEFYTLKGHTEAVVDLAWRADSNVLVSSAEDGQLILWEMTNGKQVKKWAAHGEGALSVDFAPNGEIVSGGRDKKVKVWKADGTLKKEFVASDDIVMSVAFSQDSKRVFSGDYTGNIAVWNAETGEKLGELLANPPTIQQQLAYAQKRITDLTTNLPKLEEGIKTASTEGTSVRSKFEDAKKAAADAAARKAAMEKQVADLTNQVKALTPQVQQTQEALKAKQAEAKKQADALAPLAAAFTAAQGEVTKWTAEHQKQAAALVQSTTAVEAAKQAVAKAVLDPASQKALGDAINQQKAATTARQQADANVAARTKAHQEAATKLAAAQKAQLDLQTKRDAANQAKAGAQTKVTNADTAAKAAAAKLTEATKEGQAPPPALVQAKQQADQALNAARQALATADGAAKQAEAAHAGSVKATQQAQGIVDGATQQLAEGRKVQKTAAEKLAAVDAALKPLREKEAAVKAARTKADADLVVKNGAWQKATQATNAAKGQLDAANKKLADATTKKKTVETAKTAADTAVQQANAAYSAKAKALNEARTQLAAVQPEATKAGQTAEATEKQRAAAEQAVAAVAKKEAEAKKAFEVAKAELENSQFLTKKWQAAAINLQVRDESEALGGMEEDLGDMTENVEEKAEKHQKAEAELVAAQKTLETAKKTVESGQQKLAEKTTSVLETVLKLATAKAAAGLREEVVEGNDANENSAEGTPAIDPKATALVSAVTAEAPAAEASAVDIAANEADPVEQAAEEALSTKPREDLEKELAELKGQLAKLQSYIDASYQEALQTRKTIADASQVAKKTPSVIAERSKVESAAEAEARKAQEAQEAQEAAVEAQRRKIEELRQKYLSMNPKREGEA